LPQVVCSTARGSRLHGWADHENSAHKNTDGAPADELGVAASAAGATTPRNVTVTEAPMASEIQQQQEQEEQQQQLQQQTQQQQTQQQQQQQTHSHPSGSGKVLRGLTPRSVATRRPQAQQLQSRSLSDDAPNADDVPLPRTAELSGSQTKLSAVGASGGAVAASAPAAAIGKTPAWSVEWTHQLKGNKIEERFAGRVQMLTGVMSVSDAAERLNTGVIACTAGFCLVYSATKRAHFILYQKCMKDAAFAHLGIREEEELPQPQPGFFDLGPGLAAAAGLAVGGTTWAATPWPRMPAWSANPVSFSLGQPSMGGVAYTTASSWGGLVEAPTGLLQQAPSVPAGGLEIPSGLQVPGCGYSRRFC